MPRQAIGGPRHDRVHRLHASAAPCAFLAGAETLKGNASRLLTLGREFVLLDEMLVAQDTGMAETAREQQTEWWDCIGAAIPYSSNTSGYKGVSWHKKRKKWTAEIQADGRRKYLGLYTTAEEAHQAYQDAAKALHCEFARTECAR